MSQSTDTSTNTPEFIAPDTPDAPPAKDDATDWKAEARKWEQRAKGNRDELEALTGKYSALETTNGDLNTRISTLENKSDREALLNRISEDTGVPAAALRGDTESELTAHAEQLRQLIAPSAPVVKTAGKSPGAIPSDPNRELARQLFRK